MPIAPGTKLGPYGIIALIGRGGMGEVYRAHDQRVGRDLAIKISAERFSERFEREARVIAALNHPNICQLYDVGPNYLVMELVEGPTLFERMKQGAMPLEEALRVARQISDAMDAAHQQGVVHRDLKPRNVKIRPDGIVKVLDFGLARICTPNILSENTSTVSMGPTKPGMLVGTPSYMSPEQAKGAPVNCRSDIYSFGLILYEMLTGERLHRGETNSEVLASVMKDQPPWDKLPPQVRKLLRRCLEKDPQKRLRHIGDVMELVEEGGAGRQSAGLHEAGTRMWLWPAVAATLAGLLGITLWELWPKPPSAARSTLFQLTPPEGVTIGPVGSALVLSPDGHKVVLDATGPQNGLWVRDLDSLDWRKLPGTEGAFGPFWSPDSRFLAFSAGGELRKIDVSRGPPQTLCKVAFSGTGSWNREGVIIFGGAGAGPIRRISDEGGVPVDVTRIDVAHGETFHALPTFLPDGEHFLYFRRSPTGTSGVFAGSLVSKPGEQSREPILINRFAASYASGNLFFMRDDTLMVQPFNATKLQLYGEPIPAAERVATTGSSGLFSVSSTGVLAYVTGGRSDQRAYLPTWFDRHGKLIGTIGEPGPGFVTLLSPDSSRAAVRDASINGPDDLWTLDLARGVRTRLTFQQGSGRLLPLTRLPVWSPDGSRMIFAGGNNSDTLYETGSSGGTEPKELLRNPGMPMGPTSWSRDGRFLLYDTQSKTVELWLLPLNSTNGADRKTVRLLAPDFGTGGSFSPDGRWIAYLSAESGRVEIFVRAFIASAPSGPRLGDEKWQISKDGAATAVPKWRGDGKEIIFATPSLAIMSVEVTANGTFHPGVPKQLFVAPPNTTSWDVTANCQRFLMSVPTGTLKAEARITLVLNWAADLKR